MRPIRYSLSPRVPERAPGTPATGNGARHSLRHLSLLPSGPDEVRDRLLRGDRPGGSGSPCWNPWRSLSRLLKNSASGRDPALHGFCKCSHIMNMLRFPKRRAPWLTA